MQRHTIIVTWQSPNIYPVGKKPSKVYSDNSKLLCLQNTISTYHRRDQLLAPPVLLFCIFFKIHVDDTCSCLHFAADDVAVDPERVHAGRMPHDVFEHFGGHFVF